MIDRKWREPAWRAAFCWPDLRALDSIDYIAWPGGDLLLQTVCIIPTCQRAKRGIHSRRRQAYFLSGFLVFDSQGNMSFLAAGELRRELQNAKNQNDLIIRKPNILRKNCWESQRYKIKYPFSCQFPPHTSDLIQFVHFPI